MAKIEQKNIKIFSSGATGSIEQFGTTKAGSVVYSDDPDVIMGFTGATGHTGLTGVNAWNEGLFAGITGNNVPSFQTMNSLFYVMTRWLNTWNQYGIPRWNENINYKVGSLVTNDDGNIFASYTGPNLNNALTDLDYWSILLSNKVKFVTDNYTVEEDDYLIIWNIATTGSINTITLPTISTASLAQKSREIIICVAGDTSASSVLCENESINQYEWRRFIFSGNLNASSNWSAFFHK